MSDIDNFNKELEELSQQLTDEPETKLPSLEEQKAVVAKLKQLEAEGQLTQEVLEQYFGQFHSETDTPVH